MTQRKMHAKKTRTNGLDSPVRGASYSRVTLSAVFSFAELKSKSRRNGHRLLSIRTDKNRGRSALRISPSNRVLRRSSITAQKRAPCESSCSPRHSQSTSFVIQRETRSRVVSHVQSVEREHENSLLTRTAVTSDSLGESSCIIPVPALVLSRVSPTRCQPTSAPRGGRRHYNRSNTPLLLNRGRR